LPSGFLLFIEYLNSCSTVYILIICLHTQDARGFSKKKKKFLRFFNPLISGYDTDMNREENQSTKQVPSLSSADTNEKECPSFPDDVSLQKLAEFYKVMGDATRLKVLMALEHEELCVSDLAALCSMSLSALSHQLKLLRNAKLVKSRKEGKTVYYSLDDDHIHSVIKVAFAHILEND
jgi:ArsR family transcriptional regulator